MAARRGRGVKGGSPQPEGLFSNEHLDSLFMQHPLPLPLDTIFVLVAPPPKDLYSLFLSGSQSALSSVNSFVLCRVRIDGVVGDGFLALGLMSHRLCSRILMCC